ncbi:MAG: UvrD-helicase domain-containing protein, partial [Bacteroidales bacterium]|nr:UvrD-helicase domain-containing protein [Bacteroidales bacterium]
MEYHRTNLNNIFYLYTFMEKGILTKYSASAGSGKTFELTARYIARLLNSSGQSYRKILAVTFTNKAAAEMKRKILDHLSSIAAGERTEMAERLIADTGLSFDELKIKSGFILYSILHDYSFFNVGTIDSFFQRIIRAFARETGLQHGYQVEIEHRYILDRAVDMTLEDARNDRTLMNWLIRYEYERIEEGKSWNIKNDITSLAGEIFRESFRLMDEDDRKRLTNKELLENYIGTLKKIRKDFSTELISRVQKCRALMIRHNVTDDMFFKGNSGGVGSFLQKYEKEFDGIYPPPGATVMK